MKKDREGFWKLKTSNLDDAEDFLLEFSIMWERLEVYKDIDEWWENYAKPESRALCSVYQILSQVAARSNSCMKDMLMVMLTTALEELRWDDVAVISGRLTEFMRKENLGFVVRSRYKENLESEKASMFHVNREKKKGSQRNLNKLVIGGQVVEDRNSIEELCGFFGDLFHGHHRNGGVTEDKTFEPDFIHIDEFLEGIGKLSEESKADIEKPINGRS